MTLHHQFLISFYIRYLQFLTNSMVARSCRLYTDISFCYFASSPTHVGMRCANESNFAERLFFITRDRFAMEISRVPLRYLKWRDRRKSTSNSTSPSMLFYWKARTCENVRCSSHATELRTTIVFKWKIRKYRVNIKSINYNRTGEILRLKIKKIYFCSRESNNNTIKKIYLESAKWEK